MILTGETVEREAAAGEFWDHVGRGADDACWPWLGTVHHRTGYGHYYPGGRTVMAHRMAYELTVGPIPPALVIDHLCRRRDCVNPTHMEPVTYAENNRRSNGWGGVNYRKTHCIRGHALDGTNLRINPHGWRICVKCERRRSRATRERRASERTP